jgi:hypothetical protein
MKDSAGADKICTSFRQYFLAIHLYFVMNMNSFRVNRHIEAHIPFYKAQIGLRHMEME